MKRLYALIVAAALCLPSIGAMAWWKSIQQISIGGAPAFSINFNTYAAGVNEVLTSGTSYSLPNIPIGAANANRCVVIVIAMRTSTGPFTTATVTIDTGGGPQAATLVKDSGAGGGATSSYSGVFQVTSALPSGTTATIAVSAFTATALRIAVATYSVISSTCAAPTGAAILDAAGNNPTGSITVPAGGGAILTETATGGVSSSITAPASGPVQDHSAVVGATTLLFMTGSDVTHAGATTYTITNNTVPSSPTAVFAGYAP